MVDPQYWNNLSFEEQLLLREELLRSPELNRFIQFHINKYQKELVQNYNSSSVENNTKSLTLAFRDLEVWTSIGELLNQVRLTPRATT